MIERFLEIFAIVLVIDAIVSITKSIIRIKYQQVREGLWEINPNPVIRYSELNVRLWSWDRLSDKKPSEKTEAWLIRWRRT